MGRLLVRGEPGAAIIPECAAMEGEMVIDKPGKGMFCNTDCEAILRARSVTHLVLAGVTTEVCVQTSMREANDRGFECLLVTDCTESYFAEYKAAVVSMIVAQGGIVGWASDLAALKSACK
jgi:nicotinamidase-related amidase